ncbi:hypothetical protein CSPX01_04086 [Colletotrichum filicis]|nr:hypothetical protein CSPX01_04086 [Colletotrichum filicis]
MAYRQLLELCNWLMYHLVRQRRAIRLPIFSTWRTSVEA